MSVVPFGQAVSGSRADELSITLLGATGSIGSSTLDLVHKNRDRFRVEAVTAQRSAVALAQLARDVGARLAVVGDHGCYGELKDALANSGVEAAAGEDAVVDAARRPAQWVMAAITGAAGLRPTMTALERGATIALANGCQGVVTSAREASTLRAELGEKFAIVTPGVRPAGSDAGDQVRFVTPAEAIASGASHIVVGRPITEASDPAAEARAILGQISR